MSSMNSLFTYACNFMKFYRELNLPTSKNIFRWDTPDIRVRKDSLNPQVIKIRVRWGYNGSGVNGYGATLEEAADMARVRIELLEINLHNRITSKKLDEQMQQLFARKLWDTELNLKRRMESFINTTVLPYLTVSSWKVFRLQLML